MMMNNDDSFDVKMKERFKKEVSTVPTNINEGFKDTLAFIKNQEVENMKRSIKRKKTFIVAASLVCVLAISMQTTFAQDMVNQIIRSLSLNTITIFENEEYKWEDIPLPETAQGKVFDAAGSVIEKITFDNQNHLYNEKGEQVLGVEPDGTLLTNEVLTQRLGPENLVVKDVSKLAGYTCFDIKLPTYLPDGFEFDSAEFYKYDDGKIVDKACSLNFINNKTSETLHIYPSYICEETTGETFFENIEKAKVNDGDAIVGDEGIVWESEGISYLMYTYDLGRAESIKIAESIQ